MIPQVFWEDVKEGSEVPRLVKRPTTRQLVKWAGASGDYYEIHYDKDFAVSKGLPGVIVHGWLVLVFLGQMITDWIGPDGELVRLSGTYRQVNFPDEDIVCKGKVTGKRSETGRNQVEAEIWAENPKGDIVVSGSATFTLPLRG